ncbi:MAG TPA: hypothetical protein ENN51_04270 [candidate division WOR-3 bacterium]|uniref:Uncharacterized protein n=1 Tax=candidate division WOR-3 bacterium TaxID=2052148 RepID=A0A7V0XFB8_UNCW3|nr:hypothetical protein [candidate division WOR-3 bacterium]
MRFDADPIPLQAETLELLERLRTAGRPLPLYGQEPGTAQQAVRAIAELIYEGAAVSVVRRLQYRWFANELARVFCSRTGPALVFQLELVLRKWVAFGLEPDAVQFLLRAIVERFEAEVEPVPAPPGT